MTNIPFAYRTERYMSFIAGRVPPLMIVVTSSLITYQAAPTITTWLIPSVLRADALIEPPHRIIPIPPAVVSPLPPVTSVPVEPPVASQAPIIVDRPARVTVVETPIVEAPAPVTIPMPKIELAPARSSTPVTVTPRTVVVAPTVHVRIAAPRAPSIPHFAPAVRMGAPFAGFNNFSRGLTNHLPFRMSGVMQGNFRH